MLVLSETVACALKEEGHSEMAKFVEYFVRFFDCLNVSSISEGKHKTAIHITHPMMTD